MPNSSKMQGGKSLNVKNLIDHFIEQQDTRNENNNNSHDGFVKKIAHHKRFDTEDIVHMMFITPRNDRKCLVFIRKDEKQEKQKEVIYNQKSVKQGKLVVKIHTDHL